MRREKIVLMFIVLALSICLPGMVQAKGGDLQDQIILLNDSAAALEDSHPELSKDLIQLADEKEKEWEAGKVNKSEFSPIINKDLPLLKKKIEILKAAARAIEPTYPLIAKSLNKMAQEMNKLIKKKQ